MASVLSMLSESPDIHHSELRRASESTVGTDNENDRSPALENRQPLYSPRKGPLLSSSENHTDSISPRRRVLRACDRCNAQRTKCDGGVPCSTCKRSQLTCEYLRLRRKRGRVPKRDLEAARHDQISQKPPCDSFTQQRVVTEHKELSSSSHSSPRMTAAYDQRRIPSLSELNLIGGISDLASDRLRKLPCPEPRKELGTGSANSSFTGSSWPVKLEGFEQNETWRRERPPPRRCPTERWPRYSSPFDAPNQTSNFPTMSQSSADFSAVSSKKTRFGSCTDIRAILCSENTFTRTRSKAASTPPPACIRPSSIPGSVAREI